MFIHDRASDGRNGRRRRAVLAASVLGKRGCTATETADGDLAVLVLDSRDTEEEVTEALNEAGVVCFVYRAEGENPERRDSP